MHTCSPRCVTAGAVTLSKSLKVLTRAHSLPHSLANNFLAYKGNMLGVVALSAALKDSKITNLK